ncbi:hypothetical protein FEM48_Zijuj09G0231200 [Ziziphus jujuba var. spinosa]|uniref:Uncharacterized protein n=1 Tax=Ziziphus jujuba var. spinosa TaxID=714518 RepID=A0A978UVV1_ZIZJJ|nr:hypothetical protein FEM48_Zijuj09G0231200 [Ziziphus jujuba var. spinosa]
MGLRGYPVAAKCGSYVALKSPPPASQESWFHFAFVWVTFLPGCFSGLVVGIVAGNNVVLEEAILVYGDFAPVGREKDIYKEEDGNNLRGHILQGNQFATFKTSSYHGNFGLYDYTLATRCGDSEAQNHHHQLLKTQGFHFEFNWITFMPGYVSGLAVGIATRNTVFVKKQFWFMEILHLWQMKRISVRRRRGAVRG